MNKDLKDIIDSCPYTLEFSSFEQQSFNSYSAIGYPRYIINLINRYRKAESDLEKETKTFERNLLLEEKEKIFEILNNQDIDNVNEAVANWSRSEGEYWAEKLGKIAAIEILSQGKVSYETMMKMANLPEDLYVKSSQICVKLANAIKQKTVEAEQTIGIFSDEIPATNNAASTTNVSPPKKLLLKKIK